MHPPIAHIAQLQALEEHANAGHPPRQGGPAQLCLTLQSERQQVSHSRKQTGADKC